MMDSITGAIIQVPPNTDYSEFGDEYYNSRFNLPRMEYRYRELGTKYRGRFSKVLLGYDSRTRSKVALKILKYHDLPIIQTRARREIDHLSYVHYFTEGRPLNVVKFHDAFVDRRQKFCSVFEALLCDLKTFMLHYGKILEPEKMKTVMRCVLSGLDHIHKCGIIHTHLKPSHVMIASLTTFQCKVCSLMNFIIVQIILIFCIIVTNFSFLQQALLFYSLTNCLIK